MTADLHDRLAARGLRLEPAAPLANYTTFRLGGPCMAMVHCRTPDEVVRAVQALDQAGLARRFIGGGSNLLVADSGLPDIVVRYVAEAPQLELRGDRLRVSGGTLLDELAAWAVDVGCRGLVNCSGIPGTVGGAIVGNAGAFGWQIGDAIERVDLLAPDGSRRLATPESIGFGYRDSGLKRTGDIVLAATLRLDRGSPAEAASERRRILDLRREKHPDLTRDCCAGSFFRNLEPTSAASRRVAAGRYLEDVGAKAMRVGGAGVFERHANIIVKLADDCRASDVLALSRQMAAAVKEQFGFDLVREVQTIGDFEAT